MTITMKLYDRDGVGIEDMTMERSRTPFVIVWNGKVFQATGNSWSWSSEQSYHEIGNVLFLPPVEAKP